MFDRIARRFFDHTFHPKPPVLTVPKIVTHLCLLLTGIHSLQIPTQSADSTTALFSHLDTRFVFRSSRRISSFFTFKNRVPKYLRSSWYTHSSVDAVSHRMWVKPCANLYTRMSEHLGISPISKKFSLILMPLCTQLTLTTSKFFLPPLTHTS